MSFWCWWAHFHGLFQFLHVQRCNLNLKRRSNIFVTISCLSRNRQPCCSHLWKLQGALVEMSTSKFQEPQSALGPGRKTTTPIVFPGSWPRPCVWIACITVAQWTITTEAWCRSVMAEQGKQFGNGFQLNFRWHSFLIPNFNFLWLLFLTEDYLELCLPNHFFWASGSIYRYSANWKQWVIDLKMCIVTSS